MGIIAEFLGGLSSASNRLPQAVIARGQIEAASAKSNAKLMKDQEDEIRKRSIEMLKLSVAEYDRQSKETAGLIKTYSQLGDDGLTRAQPLMAKWKELERLRSSAYRQLQDAVMDRTPPLQRFGGGDLQAPEPVDAEFTVEPPQMGEGAPGETPEGEPIQSAYPTGELQQEEAELPFTGIFNAYQAKKEREAFNTAAGWANRAGIPAGVMKYQESLGQAMTEAEKAEVAAKLELFVPFDQTDTARRGEWRKDTARAVQNSPSYLEAGGQFRFALDGAREQGILVSDEEEEQMFETLVTPKLVAESLDFTTGEMTELRESFRGLALTDKVLSMVDTEEGWAKFQEMFGPVSGRWNSLKTKMNLSEDGVVEPLDAEEKMLMARIRWFNQVMGRQLTGAAIQPFEQSVFDELFGAINQPLSSVAVNLKNMQEAFQGQIDIVYGLRKAAAEGKPYSLEPEDEAEEELDWDNMPSLEETEKRDEGEWWEIR